jgi:hypothetical protein
VTNKFHDDYSGGTMQDQIPTPTPATQACSADQKIGTYPYASTPIPDNHPWADRLLYDPTRAEQILVHDLLPSRAINDNHRPIPDLPEFDDIRSFMRRLTQEELLREMSLKMLSALHHPSAANQP